MVRKETPSATASCLHRALTAALEQPEVQKAILATGSKPAGPHTLEESARQFAAEATRFQSLAKAIKLEPQ
jgi:tripartite-type tricarboxylate transporter receptor subunit TctC